MAAPREVDRGALVGAMVAGGFGAAWSLWAASGLSGRAGAVTRAAGVLVALAIVIVAAVLRRSRPQRTGPDDGSMFSSSAYRITVLVEVAALIGGNVLLNETGHEKYVIAWVAAVVGAHFLAFGRLFWAGFYWLGGALLADAALAAIVGLSGGGTDAVTACCGVVAAVSLFASGISTLVRGGAG